MEAPTSEIHIIPYPRARTRWDYFRTQQVNEEIRETSGDSHATAGKLTRYIFDTHPDVLDLAPAVSHRFHQSQAVMARFPQGEKILEGTILARFQEAEERLKQGYSFVVTSTIIGSDPKRPSPMSYDGSLVQKINLPEQIQRRALAWNVWVQEMIKKSDIDKLFSHHPEWLGVKPAEGILFQAGNLMFEVVEGLGRLYLPDRTHNLTKRWKLGGNMSWPDDGEPDQWFVMTHIVEKDLLELSRKVGENMIDGKKLTPEVYARSYIPILQLIALNPQLSIKGVLSDGSWIYSQELTRLFPSQHISDLHDIAGDVVDIGTAGELNLPEQIDFATHDPTRREAFLEGRYKVNVAARFIDPEGMRGVIQRFGLKE